MKDASFLLMSMVSIIISRKVFPVGKYKLNAVIFVTL